MSVAKKYSHLGIAIVFYMILSNILASVVVAIASFIYTLFYMFSMMADGGMSTPTIDPALATEITTRFSSNTGMINLASMCVSYFVCIPLTILILNSRGHRDIPTLSGFKFSTPYENSLKRNLTPWEFFNFLMFMFPLGIIGSAIGAGLAYLVSLVTGNDMNNLLTSMISDMPLGLVLLLTVILAPIFEEILFRYAVVGYCRRYGEWNAIFVSGFIFGLIHTNIFQFFYAFFLGIVLAYVYVYTRRLIYTIIMHMTFNCFGAFIPLLIDPTLKNATSPGMIIYNLVQYGLAIIGFILLIMFIAKGNLLQNTPGAPIQGKFSIKSILNVGMIALILVCTGLTILISVML
ncbi:CPBP family intramembrane glutamic endopeptidase [Butyrivibrio sp. FC2001]|uniref:CPBP family intramembrane glutamic endopeptidase n=1 Tax=Butyrivibrio sp. FC2001 TaxID=1280671 RepID=UPI00041E0CD3|nr:CPBP family intramembrane glutamic endopeptidase [Butyrivibrio sp. FC2001]